MFSVSAVSHELAVLQKSIYPSMHSYPSYQCKEIWANDTKVKVKGHTQTRVTQSSYGCPSCKSMQKMKLMT